MKRTIRTYAPLAALLAFAVFPFGWLTKISDGAYAVAKVLFPNEAAHAVGHALLFTAVGAALLAAFPALRRRPGRYFGLVLLVAVAQEGMQLLYKRRPVMINELADIAIDLAAAGLVFALWYSRSKGAGRRAGATDESEEQRRGGHHAAAPGRRG
ncbi:MAG TPA: hypothetical protein PKD53_29905 [Chloroflexaceae bacterium]|mgnify:CR=1 FL=1|nr:hypothetical protein [Chloroflexaceae bacterium]